MGQHIRQMTYTELPFCVILSGDYLNLFSGVCVMALIQSGIYAVVDTDSKQVIEYHDEEQSAAERALELNLLFGTSTFVSGALTETSPLQQDAQRAINFH
jgi:hypothetical protein